MPIKSNAGKSRLFVSYIGGANQFPVPQTIFADATGKEIGRIVGYKAPSKFQEQMTSILGDRVT